MKDRTLVLVYGAVIDQLDRLLEMGWGQPGSYTICKNMTTWI